MMGPIKLSKLAILTSVVRHVKPRPDLRWPEPTFMRVGYVFKSHFLARVI